MIRGEVRRAVPAIALMALLGLGTDLGHAQALSTVDAARLLARVEAIDGRCRFLDAADHDALKTFAARAEVAAAAKAAPTKPPRRWRAAVPKARPAPAAARAPASSAPPTPRPGAPPPASPAAARPPPRRPRGFPGSPAAAMAPASCNRRLPGRTSVRSSATPCGSRPIISICAVII